MYFEFKKCVLVDTLTLGYLMNIVVTTCLYKYGNTRETYNNKCHC